MTTDRFPHYTQLDSMDCGPTCLRMIARYYGRRYSLETLRDKAFITREGVSMGLCQNECFDAAPLRCVRISKMQGIEDEGDRSLLE